MQEMQFPLFVPLNNNMSVPGEFAFLIMLWRLHYPSTLAMMQDTFGIDYTQISRIFNESISIMDGLHRHKVCGNIFWYRSRFNMYNHAISRKISSVYQNPNPGTVPVALRNLFGFIDGTSRPILRPYRHNNAQFPFWNGYYHTHCLIYLGVSFPDGMTVIEVPKPGYFTDIMFWRDCTIRHQLDDIMIDRINRGMPRLKMYADKIFDTGPLITAAYSLRHGAVSPRMLELNDIMTGIRVAVEWAFGKIISRSKHSSYRQKIQESPVISIYLMSVLLANAHTCIYGSQHTLHFGIKPPELDEYFGQR